MDKNQDIQPKNRNPFAFIREVENIEDTARHEAGHLVMKWYLRLPATETIVINANEGICLGRGEELREDDGKFLTAAGCAAELHLTPEVFERVMRDYPDEYAEAEELSDDFDVLWHLFDRWEIYSDRMIYNFCIMAFYEARNILRHNWKLVDEVTKLLLDNRRISQAEAQKLFQKWGKPDYVPTIYTEIAPRLLDVTEDCARLAEGKRPCGKFATGFRLNNQLLRQLD